MFASRETLLKAVHSVYGERTNRSILMRLFTSEVVLRSITELSPKGLSPEATSSLVDTLMDRLSFLVEERYRIQVTRLSPIVEYAPDEGGIYRIDQRGAPPIVLRLFARNRLQERVLGDAAILRYLELHRVPAERLIPTHSGEGAAELEDQGVVITRFVAGHRPDRSPTTLRELGKTLGKIHALPQAPSDNLQLRRRAGSLPSEDLAYGRAQLARIAGNVPGEQSSKYEALKAALETIDDGETLPFALTHGDCHLDNFVLAQDNTAVLIDWAGAGQGPRMAALGLLLYSSAVASPGDPLDGRDRSNRPRLREAVDAVIDGYCQYSIPTDDELAYLPNAIRVRPTVVDAREFAATIESGKPSSPFGWWQYVDLAESVAALSHDAITRRSS